MAYRIKTPLKSDKKVKVVFDATAYAKALSYVAECDIEIAFHGLIERVGDMEFFVEDVFLFPQKAGPATVDVDEEKYALWMAKTYDTPEKMVKNRLHIHSHVNMGVSPSGTDNKYRQEQTAHLEADTDSFYLFMIWNKQGAWSGELFDYKNMIVWETGDVEIKIRKSKTETVAKEDIAKEIEENLTRKSWGAAPATTSQWNNVYKRHGSDWADAATHWGYEPRYDSKGYVGEQVRFEKLFEPADVGYEICDGCAHCNAPAACRAREAMYGLPKCFERTSLKASPLGDDEDF